MPPSDRVDAWPVPSVLALVACDLRTMRSGVARWRRALVLAVIARVLRTSERLHFARAAKEVQRHVAP